ncbi:hypothetical protein D3C86_1568500 [compost metagenome]
MRVFEFIHEVSKLPKNNPIFPFILPKEIVETLKEQFSGLFQRLLQEESNKNQIDTIKSLNETTDLLKKTIEFVIDKNNTVFGDVILTNHPAFRKIRDLLEIKHRIIFTNLEELNELLHNYKYIYNSNEISKTSRHSWNRTTEHWDELQIHISSALFDENNRLIPESRLSWNENFIEFEKIIGF